MARIGQQAAGRGGTPVALAFARGVHPSSKRLIVLLQFLRCAVGAGTAVALARLTGDLVEQGALDHWVLGVAAAGILMAVLLGSFVESRTAWLEAAIGAVVIDVIGRRLADMPAREVEALSRGAILSSLQRHPGALARLAVGHAVARRMVAFGPLLIAGTLAIVSWQAALALLAATPVLIVFFALVGGTIRDRAEAQERALGRLASQFADRVRALPTILANHALERECTKLDSRLEAYARGTMGVLAVAFLNAGVLDFFGALAIAILAVFLGLGHLGLVEIPGFAHLALWQSLAILLLAPEYFAPFRRYAELYHAKAEGDAAASALDWAFPGAPDRVARRLERSPTRWMPARRKRARQNENGETASDPIGSDAALVSKCSGGARAGDDRAAAPKHRLGARGLFLAHVGPIADFDLPHTGLVAIVGPSGAGKSTLLRALAGVEPPEHGTIRLPRAEGCSWASVETPIKSGTLRDAIAAGTQASDEAVGRVGAMLGMQDDPHWLGGLEAPIHAGAENLSGGQRLRIAVARVLLRPGIAVCDEPTAKLDPLNASRVRRALREAARTRLVLVTTHDPTLAASADHCIALGRPSSASKRQAA